MNSNESESLTDSQIVQYVAYKMRDEGMLDKIRLEVRKELVDQLMHEPKDKKKPKSFDAKVVDCIIQNFLRTNHLNCTHDIFTQESHLDSKDFLETQELLQLFGLQLRDFEDYLFRLSQGNISALEIFLGVLKKRYHVEKQDHSCQTESGELTYEQKMRELEGKYLKKVDYSRLNDMQAIEERMNLYRKDIERKYKSQLEADLARMREWEIEAMRQQERARFDQKLRQMQGGDNADYNQKLQELKKKEKEALDRINLRTKELERNMFEKKQELQKQMDELEQEKIKFHRHKCLDSDIVKKELEELEGVKADLKKAIKEYQTSKECLEKQREKQAEEAASYWREKMKADRENKDPGKQGETDWIAYQKDTCLRLQHQREYLKSENDTLRQEVLDLQFRMGEMQKELDRCRQEILQAKDERDIEHNHNQRLQGQIRLLSNIKNDAQF